MRILDEKAEQEDERLYEAYKVAQREADEAQARHIKGEISSEELTRAKDKAKDLHKKWQTFSSTYGDKFLGARVDDGG